MYLIAFMFRLFPFLLFLFASTTMQAQTATVVLNIQGVQVDKGGEISAGIFLRENFPKVGKQFLGTEKVVAGNSMQIVFKDVPPGVYGVVAFQDIDKNKDLKTNFIGFPKEPIGFSNDAKINFGPPAFDDAKVTAEAGRTLTLTIILR